MKEKHVTIGIMASVGVLFLVGAIGNGDYHGALSTADIIRIVIGFLMIGIAFGIGKFCADEEDEEQDEPAMRGEQDDKS